MLSKPLADRFWEKVDVRSPSECWEWTADKHGKLPYGKIKVERKTKLAHRISYELNRGAIPEGMQVLHSCHNPSCVNPNHLRLGTHKENMKDRQDACRQARGVSNGNCKLTEAEALLIAAVLKRIPPTLKRKELGFGINSFLARWFGINHRMVSLISQGKNWRHINAH